MAADTYPMRLALSEVFTAKMRTRVDPLLAEWGFRRVEGTPWYRVVYANTTRSVAFEVHLDPRKGPRRLRVALGRGPGPATAIAGGGRPPDDRGGSEGYLLASAESLDGTFDVVVADLARVVGDWDGRRPSGLREPNRPSHC